MTVRDRLDALGITLPSVAVPVAAYVPAVLDGRRVWTSGQLPFADGVLLATGKVGDEQGQVPLSYAAHLARIAALNAVAAIGSVADLDAVERIVKVVVFVASDPSFTGQPAVANGASTLLGEVFGEAGAHARSAVGVAVLPLDSPVEVEVVAALR
jgi:enamine deaminase RidA (YjgF/YER057c/UK114 family)